MFAAARGGLRLAGIKPLPVQSNGTGCCDNSVKIQYNKSSAILHPTNYFTSF